MEKLQRTQVLLEPTQHQTLYRLAQAEGRSMSELIREAVAQYLVEREAVDDSWQETLAELTRFREEMQRKHGTLPADFIVDERTQREEEIWRRMTGEE